MVKAGILVLFVPDPWGKNINLSCTMVISLFDLKYHLFSLYSFSLTRGLSSLLTEKTKQNFVFCIVLFFTDLWSYITICFTCFGFFPWFFWLLEKYTQSIKYQNFIYFFSYLRVQISFKILVCQIPKVSLHVFPVSFIYFWIPVWFVFTLESLKFF